MQNGVATVAALRLRTPDTTLVGAGRIDLPNKHVDLTVKTESGETSFLALKLPLHVSGSFDHLSVAPVLSGSDAPVSSAPPGRLAPELQRVVERNPCLA